MMNFRWPFDCPYIRSTTQKINEKKYYKKSIKQLNNNLTNRYGVRNWKV